MGDYYLAVDIGASGGRHILGHLQDGYMITEEVYRFENGMKMNSGELCWDIDMLFDEIKAGMKKCKDIGKIPRSIGVDTWGVDFVLLDKNDNIIGNTVGYRDSRTQGMDKKVYTIIPEEKLYERTGIQKQIFNTIYQLTAVKERHPEHLKNAACILMIPDYIHFLLSGVKSNEYTNSTTTQLIDPKSKKWDFELIEMLGLPKDIFGSISMPGAVLGSLAEKIQEEVGYNCQVVIPATHDTASAVLAVPSNDQNTVYISSGTWSLMGIERTDADCSQKSREHNFTNEGGYDYRFRYLKNIMGLWMIQSVKKEFQTSYTYSGLCDLASKENIGSIVDCNNSCFLAPDSMIDEIKRYCRETGQREPVTDAEIAAVIYNSLAVCYCNTIEEIEELTGRPFKEIHVVGGGANAGYLNHLTASYTGRRVTAGPAEATAIGNIMAQMMHYNELVDLNDARSCVYKSFNMKTYENQEV